MDYVRSLSEASRRTSIEEQYEAEAGALRIELYEGSGWCGGRCAWVCGGMNSGFVLTAHTEVNQNSSIRKKQLLPASHATPQFVEEVFQRPI